jgi:hypothetical protein
MALCGVRPNSALRTSNVALRTPPPPPGQSSAFPDTPRDHLHVTPTTRGGRKKTIGSAEFLGGLAAWSTCGRISNRILNRAEVFAFKHARNGTGRSRCAREIEPNCFDAGLRTSDSRFVCRPLLARARSLHGGGHRRCLWLQRDQQVLEILSLAEGVQVVVFLHLAEIFEARGDGLLE